jgi:hypothetical protein
MSTIELLFKTKSDGETIYDPQQVSSTAVEIVVTNLSDQDLVGLGLFITPATNVGDVDNPADYPPATDYQDILTWGTKSDLGLSVSGGLKIVCPQNDAATFTGYVTRTVGATYSTRIPFIDLSAGDSAEFSIEFETPPSVPARRFFVDLKLE